MARARVEGNMNNVHQWQLAEGAARDKDSQIEIELIHVTTSCQLLAGQLDAFTFVPVFCHDTKADMRFTILLKFNQLFIPSYRLL